MAINLTELLYKLFVYYETFKHIWESSHDQQHSDVTVNAHKTKLLRWKHRPATHILGLWNKHRAWSLWQNASQLNWTDCHGNTGCTTFTEELKGGVLGHKKCGITLWLKCALLLVIKVDTRDCDSRNLIHTLIFCYTTMLWMRIRFSCNKHGQLGSKTTNSPWQVIRTDSTGMGRVSGLHHQTSWCSQRAHGNSVSIHYHYQIILQYGHNWRELHTNDWCVCYWLTMDSWGPFNWTSRRWKVVYIHAYENMLVN